MRMCTQTHHRYIWPSLYYWLCSTWCSPIELLILLPISATIPRLLSPAFKTAISWSSPYWCVHCSSIPWIYESNCSSSSYASLHSIIGLKVALLQLDATSKLTSIKFFLLQTGTLFCPSLWSPMAMFIQILPISSSTLLIKPHSFTVFPGRISFNTFTLSYLSLKLI